MRLVQQEPEMVENAILHIRTSDNNGPRKMVDKEQVTRSTVTISKGRVSHGLDFAVLRTHCKLHIARKIVLRVLNNQGLVHRDGCSTQTYEDSSNFFYSDSVDVTD
jgi:hypothetical protein